MKKKLMFTIMLTLLAGILINNAALVQAPQSGRSRSSGRRGVGQVTAIGTDQFTATTRNDKNNQFLVDENTRFQHSYQSAASFKDLAAGQWVVVIAAPRLGESSESRPEFTARLIVLLSEEIDPAQHFSVHTRGVITGTKLAASTF